MKMKRNLILLGILLLVAVGLVIVAPKLKPGGAGASATASTAATLSPEDIAKLKFVSYANDQVKEVTVENPSGTFTIAYDGKTCTLKGQENVTLDQASAMGVISAVAAVTGDRVIAENPTDLATYGLDKPQAKATATYTDGKTATFLLGSASGSSEYTYYVMMQGDPRLMTVSSGMGDAMLKAPQALMSVATIPFVDVNEISSIIVKKDQQTVAELTNLVPESKISIYDWRVVKPFNHAADMTELGNYQTAILAVKFSSVEDGDVKDLAKYGLDKPARELIVTGSGKYFDLKIGKDKDDTYTYAMLSDSNKVYLIGKSQIEFLNASAYKLADPMLVLVDVKNVESVVFDGLGAKGTLSVTQVPSMDTNGKQKVDGNGKPMFDQTFKLEGKDVEADLARYYYQFAIGVAIHSQVEDGWKPTGAPVATLTFNRLIDPKVISAEFYEYSQDFYAVKMDGAFNFKVRKEEVKEVADNLALFVQGKLEKPKS